MGIIKQVGGMGMKRRIVAWAMMINIGLLLVSGCSSIWDLKGKDTYEGLPVYQFDVENETVTIDGVLYKEIDSLPGPVINGDIFCYIWYEPHYEIEGGVTYMVRTANWKEDGKYLYAESLHYDIGKLPITFGMYLERVDEENEYSGEDSWGFSPDPEDLERWKAK